MTRANAPPRPTAICNANGPRPSLFVPEISFDLLVRRQIARLEQPGLQCVDLVFDELQRMALQCETTELTRFPELRDRVTDVVTNMLRACVGPTRMMISNLIKIELAYINTSHPDFIGGSRAVAQLMDRAPEESTRGATPTGAAPAEAAPPVAASSELPGARRASGASGVGTNPFSPPSDREEKNANGFMSKLFGGKNKNVSHDEVVTLPQVVIMQLPSRFYSLHPWRRMTCDPLAEGARYDASRLKPV